MIKGKFRALPHSIVRYHVCLKFLGRTNRTSPHFVYAIRCIFYIVYCNWKYRLRSISFYRLFFPIYCIFTKYTLKYFNRHKYNFQKSMYVFAIYYNKNSINTNMLPSPIFKQIPSTYVGFNHLLYLILFIISEVM